MDDTERYRQQATILEDAIRKCLELDEERGLPVGWFVAVAVRDPEHFDVVAHRYFAPEGQPQYATVGLLLTNLDALRGIGGTVWTDEG